MGARLRPGAWEIVMAQQFVFNSRGEADAFYAEWTRLGRTLSLPFLNHQGQWQITMVWGS